MRKVSERGRIRRREERQQSWRRSASADPHLLRLSLFLSLLLSSSSPSSEPPSSPPPSLPLSPSSISSIFSISSGQCGMSPTPWRRKRARRRRGREHELGNEHAFPTVGTGPDDPTIDVRLPRPPAGGFGCPACADNIRKDSPDPQRGREEEEGEGRGKPFQAHFAIALALGRPRKTALQSSHSLMLPMAVPKLMLAMLMCGAQAAEMAHARLEAQGECDEAALVQLTGSVSSSEAKQETMAAAEKEAARSTTSRVGTKEDPPPWCGDHQGGCEAACRATQRHRTFECFRNMCLCFTDFYKVRDPDYPDPPCLCDREEARET